LWVKEDLINLTQKSMGGSGGWGNKALVTTGKMTKRKVA